MKDDDLDVSAVISDADEWDNRELGADEEFVQVASDDEIKAFMNAIGKSEKQ